MAEENLNPPYDWRSRRQQLDVRCRCDDCHVPLAKTRSGFCEHCLNGRQGENGHEDRPNVFADGGYWLSWCTGHQRYVPKGVKYTGDREWAQCNLCRSSMPYVPSNPILEVKGVAPYPDGYVHSFFPSFPEHYFIPGMIIGAPAEQGPPLQQPNPQPQVPPQAQPRAAPRPRAPPPQARPRAALQPRAPAPPPQRATLPFTCSETITPD